MGFGGGDANLYTYVTNDPVNLIDPAGTDWLDSSLTVLSDLSAGFGDAISFGITEKVREAMGTNGVVDPCSGAYKLGEFAATLHDLARGGTKSFVRLGVRAAGKRLDKLSPDRRAAGPHSVFRTGDDGRVTKYETYQPQTNQRNPNPWESVKRYDGDGGEHFNKATREYVPTPHVHDPLAPGGVRPPLPGELPPGY